jgi:hypothetical protein
MQAARMNVSRPGPSRTAAQPGGSARRAVAAAPRAAAAAPDSQQAPATVPVTFNLNHKVNFGQEVLLVGSHEALGAWRVDNAVRASWSEGHQWSASVNLPAGELLEFKFVVSDPANVEWEAGSNRSLTVDAAAAVLAGSWGKELVPVGVAVSYDADDEEDQSTALAAAAKPAQQQEKAAAAAPVPAEKVEVVAKAKEEAKEAAAAVAAAEEEEEAKQAARSGVVLGAAAAPATKKPQPRSRSAPRRRLQWAA